MIPDVRERRKDVDERSGSIQTYMDLPGSDAECGRERPDKKRSEKGRPWLDRASFFGRTASVLGNCTSCCRALFSGCAVSTSAFIVGGWQGSERRFSWLRYLARPGTPSTCRPNTCSSTHQPMISQGEWPPGPGELCTARWVCDDGFATLAL